MILTELKNGVQTIILNNPAKMNCIGFEMLYGLQEAISAAAEDNAVSVVVIRGNGEKAFSSGANTKEFTALEGKEVEKWIRLGNAIFNQLEQLPKPTVAYLQGYAMGGGLEMALACDFRLAHPSAILSSPEVSNGWLPGWGGMCRLRRLVGEANAKQIVLLSEKLDAKTALEKGLITRICSSENAEQEVLQFVYELNKLNPKTYALAKAALMDSSRTTTGSDIDFDVLAVNLAQRD